MYSPPTGSPPATVYDAEGNLVQKTRGANAETWTYAYDHRNQLTRAEQRSSAGGALMQAIDYVYDINSLRIGKYVTSGMIFTPWRGGYDGGDVWADLDNLGALQSRRQYGDAVDQVFARVDAAGAAAWYLPDRQGSVRDLADGAGVLRDHRDYGPYGEVLSETNPSFGDRYAYTGRERDAETGLQYHWHRYLDPVTGRWTSQDPLGFDAGDQNLYRYVNNDPANGADPDGRETVPTGAKARAGLSNVTADVGTRPAGLLEDMLRDGLAHRTPGHSRSFLGPLSGGTDSHKIATGKDLSNLG